MIPGWLIGLLTFPGVIVHELAHQLFCRWARVAVFEVKYFQIKSQPLGYVLHEQTNNPIKNILIGVGPFIINSVLGAFIAMPAIISVMTFETGSPLDYVLMWLGISVAMHAFPSTADAANIWKSVTAKETNFFVKILGEPIVGLIYIGALGSVVWLDVIYGVAISYAVPGILIKMMS
jgi:predicted small integral membrane protein